MQNIYFFCRVIVWSKALSYVWGMKTYLKERKEYLTWRKNYYHLSSDGWQEGKLFHQDSQFAYGMSLVGLLTLRFKITIYDFTLMDNHIHLLLSGTGAECCAAFDYFRLKLSARLVKDGYPPLPTGYGFKLKPVKNEEQMRINYLYIDRNALDKGLCVPGGYPWGSAYLHCSQMSKFFQGVSASSLSNNKMEQMLGTRTPIPPHWQFHPKLGLLPEGFVNTTLFKRLFPSPKDYQTRLVKEYEAFAKMGQDLHESIMLTEQEIAEMADRIVRNTFPGKQIQSLSNDEKGKLCVTLVSQFSLTTSQVAGVLSMPEYLVKQFLSSKDYGKKKW